MDSYPAVIRPVVIGHKARYASLIARSTPRYIARVARVTPPAETVFSRVCLSR
jgi:hypothetical protein